MKRNPGAAVDATAADRALPPYLVVPMGSAVECCGCIVQIAPPPSQDVCDCRCHAPSRMYHRLLHNIDGRDDARAHEPR